MWEKTHSHTHCVHLSFSRYNFSLYIHFSFSVSNIDLLTPKKEKNTHMFILHLSQFIQCIFFLCIHRRLPSETKGIKAEQKGKKGIHRKKKHIHLSIVRNIHVSNKTHISHMLHCTRDERERERKKITNTCLYYLFLTMW